VKRVAFFVTMVIWSISVTNPVANAGQQQWGASYLDWSGSLLSADSSISQIIQPLEISPNTYWEAGWHWDNVPDGGYGGIQSNGILADGRISDLAIFSIWNGLGAIPGEGAGCTRFGGEGIGYSCRISVNLKAGNKYEISFGVDKERGPQWWVATIADLSLGTKKIIGSIETNSTNAKASNWNNFIEYWGQAVPCDSVGPASAKFYVPSSTDTNVEIHSPIFSRPAKPCVISAGDTPPPGFIGDAVIRFGGAQQAPSTQNMPYRQTKAQLAADKAAAAADKAAIQGKSIQCVKGKSSLKVIGKNPKCPTGYKRGSAPLSASILAYGAPIGVFWEWSTTGAIANWKAPAETEGITGYNIEIQNVAIGGWKLVKVSATHFKQEIALNVDGLYLVKVSTVYSDGKVLAGKIHGLARGIYCQENICTTPL
jgi:hypothetical protein